MIEDLSTGVLRNIWPVACPACKNLNGEEVGEVCADMCDSNEDGSVVEG